jgi:Fic family protein
MKDYKKIFAQMLNEHYFSSKELMYSTDANIMLTPHEYKELLEFKKTLLNSKTKYIQKIDLKTFNDAPIHYANSFELLSSANIYFKAILDDYNENKKTLFSRNVGDITLSRIYSEIEGSLNIESVPTTRRAVDELAKGKREPQNKNDQIIKNMIDAIIFVSDIPDFNESNLFKLYSILSKDCLDEEDKLLEGNIYRHDQVEIGGYKGCPVNQIKDCMDSLFSFINENKKNSDYVNLLPHIAHYYIAYVHPYFDFNGRTARMVSYWISLLINRTILPPVVSEAINQTKSQYYEALSETRDSNNDLSYFLLYIFNISTKYILAYKNIEEISQDLMNKQSVVLTSTEKSYFKKILISNKGKFTHNEFTQRIGVNMSKQGALKVLNAFEEYGLLTSETSKSNNKLFEINHKIIKYAF